MTDKVECVVVGAGVVGLAIARALALQGHEVIVLESEKTFGTHTSSRNSEVIHAGIYYPTGSLKARTCVSGKALLYDYCRQHKVDFQRLGKLIVATTSEQIDLLRAYQAQGRINGVDDLELLSQGELHQLEPDVRGSAALWSPSTGIVDSHGLMLSLLGDFENAGGALVTRTTVNSFRQIAEGFEMDVGSEGLSTKLQSRWLINSAGHGAIVLAKGSGMDQIADNYYPAGHYFSYQGKSPFNHLIYPVAGTGSLGVHGTLDIGGHLKFGPDLEWRERLDYSFESNETRRQHFENSIRAYYPALEVNRLQSGYVGIRPRISGPDEPLADFKIMGPESHAMKGLVQLFGIESPGLTACLAIADEVVSRLIVD
ncbi:MAG: NAD(P)/FAD-dependent oxidoreductase [Xanthomonadales bacterium]|nr:NAD(P)/FAD-dependent oxidoreductase [Xanthomonadales bacterium]